MASTTPYIIRAIHDWCSDEGFTPYLLVDATHPEAVVPEAHIAEGAIVLNIASGAVRNLELGNEWILFSARFGGVAMDINVPVDAVRAIYARENGMGFGFPDEENMAIPARIGSDMTELESVVDASEADDTEHASNLDKPDAPTSAPKRKKPRLKLVE